MIKKIVFSVFLLAYLYPQWAMWGNPSLPVGGSDTGIGLGAGEVMLFADFSYQYFDWWHDIIPDASVSSTCFNLLSQALIASLCLEIKSS